MHQSVSYIPIDYLKAEIIGISPDIFDANPLLDFISPFNRNTGEVYEKRTAKYKNLEIIIFKSNRIELRGSLHILSNNGKHNHNDFTHTDFKLAILELEQSLHIKPYNLRVINLEWGFNIKPQLNVNELIEGLIQHRGINKTVGLDNKHEGHYTQFKHKDYILKMYNKSEQYHVDVNILRIEIKQINFHKFRREGIYTLEDFNICDKSIFLNELLKQWKKVIIYDLPLNSPNYKYSNKRFWEPNNLKSDRSKNYHFNILKLLSKKEGNNTSEVISKIIMKKALELQSIECKLS